MGLIAAESGRSLVGFLKTLSAHVISPSDISEIRRFQTKFLDVFYEDGREKLGLTLESFLGCAWAEIEEKLPISTCDL